GSISAHSLSVQSPEDKHTLVALGVIQDYNFHIEGIQARLAPIHSRRETMAASNGVWLLELARATNPPPVEVVRMDLHQLGLSDVGLSFAVASVDVCGDRPVVVSGNSCQFLHSSSLGRALTGRLTPSFTPRVRSNCCRSARSMPQK